MEGEFHCEIHSMERDWSSGMFDMKDENSERLLKKAKEIKEKCGKCIGGGCLVDQYLKYRENQKQVT